MTKIGLAAAVAMVLSMSVAQAQEGAAPQRPAPVPLDKAKLGYALGYKLGNDINQSKTEVDMAQVIRGVQDASAKKDPAFSREDLAKQLYSLDEKLRTEARAEFDKVATENKAASDKYLAENRAKKGVVTLPSGIQYRVIDEGNGNRPTKTSTVKVHYRGSLPNGTEFDSSFARGEPVEFQVDQVLKGWQEVLPLMRVGDMWQIVLPPDQAFGEQGPRGIGPNQALVYDIKLMEIK